MFRGFVGVIAASMFLLAPGVAQAWPDRSVKMVVPFNPGGGTDQQARLVEKPFQEEFGQGLNFVYKPGADGAIGATELASYPADGYSIAVHSFPLLLMNTLTNKGRYTVDSFDYLAISNRDVAVLVTRKGDSIASFEDFIKQAKANPVKKLTVGVVETLGPSHIAALKLQQQGVPMNIVTMAGGAKGLSAVLGGHLDVLMSVKGAVQNSAEKLQYLAVAAPERDPELPDVQTMAEGGYAVNAVGARIWIAPKGLPGDVKARLVEGFRKIYAREDVKDRNANAGQSVQFGDDKELQKLMQDFAAEGEALVKLYKETK